MADTEVAPQGVKRARLTCMNCRRKKVKCHGERPACSFCARLGQVCEYPNAPPLMPIYHELPPEHKPSALSDSNYDDLLSRISQIESRLNSVATSADTNSPNLLEFSMGDIQSLLETIPKTSEAIEAWQSSPPIPQASVRTANPAITVTTGTANLPPIEVQNAIIDLYFEYCHNQPYSFFHEQSFRRQQSKSSLPEYLILAVLAMASRFSPELYGDLEQSYQISSRYAAKAWKDIVPICFESEAGPDWRVVQTATLLSVYDFTACKHGAAWIKIGLAVSTAQSLHMMAEPKKSLSIIEQEEHRRTLWSIYLLDKLATCGRGRPSLFLDQTCTVHLPCSELAFRRSVPEKVVTLGQFKHLDDDQDRNIDSFARTITLASVLSQVSACAFLQNGTTAQKPPWDHSSDFQAARSQLSRFETLFDCFEPIQERIGKALTAPADGLPPITESFVFSHVLYHLCQCLLHHPFLLRRQLELCKSRTPVSFWGQAMQDCWRHAESLTQTLISAKIAGFRVAATFLSYSALIAGSVHCLFQHSPDDSIQQKSRELLQGSLNHLKDKATLWRNSASMESALRQFSQISAKYSWLIDITLETAPLSQTDEDYLYSLCDYGNMSTMAALPGFPARQTDQANPSHDNSAKVTEASTNLETFDFFPHSALANDVVAHDPSDGAFVIPTDNTESDSLSSVGNSVNDHEDVIDPVWNLCDWTGTGRNLLED